jgi:hypothetical protein
VAGAYWKAADSGYNLRRATNLFPWNCRVTEPTYEEIQPTDSSYTDPSPVEEPPFSYGVGMIINLYMVIRDHVLIA